MKLRQLTIMLITSFALGMTGIALPEGALAQTQIADEPLSDVSLEARARGLMKQIRCVVCQAQSIDESDAGVASDMRRLIRQQVANGQSDAEILTYLSDRYGDFVLFKPPYKAATALLWSGPFLLLIIGGIVIVVFFRHRSITSETTFSAAERDRIAAALQADSALSSSLSLPPHTESDASNAARRDA